MNIYINDKETFYPQYEFKILKIDTTFTNINNLLNYLIDNYPGNFNEFMDYTFYKINNVNNFKWTWNYPLLLNTNTELLQNNDNIENITDIYIFYHHSQHNEDYIIERIFNKIQTFNKTFVDIGSKDGKYISNVYSLIRQDWNGLLIDPIADSQLSNHKLTFIKDYALPENLENLLDSNNIPLNFDFLNIDIDGNDIHLLITVINKYSPRVICIEANARDDLYKKEIYFEYKKNNGIFKQASILSLMKVLNNTHSLVYNNGGNCFFVNNTEVSKLNKFNKNDIKEYVLGCKKVIAENEPNTTTHIKDRISRLNKFTEYINNDFEEHYPYILCYNF